jgi:predicted ferric reductase
MRAVAIWAGLALVMAVPLVAAGFSPQLAWRQPIYIIAGFAGIAGLALMVVQPLLAAGVLPGVERFRGRRLHRYLGIGFIAAVVVHVAGLWVFSPPDVIDALLFRSPTPFSVWGVLAMWALFGAAALAVFRTRLRLRVWRVSHSGLVSVAVAGTIAHALLIQGTMEPVTKALLCGFVAVVLAGVLIRQRAWSKGARPS